jgi:MYXO-CTERM domain-containing protein
MSVLVAASILFFATFAFAHGAAPRVKEIRWPAHGDGAVWLVDELGLLDERADGYHWLCDDTVSALVGFDSVHSVDASGDVWVVATRAGVFRTIDRGCSFTRVEGPLTEHVVVGLWGHPERPNEVLTSTQTLNIPNDVWRSTDGGLTWIAGGIQASARVRSVVRSAANPDVIYATHGDGASRSVDGGISYVPIALGPPIEAFPDGLEVLPQEFRLLTGHPLDEDIVFGLIERFPDSFLVRTVDGGANWTIVMAIGDAPDSIAFDADGQRALLTSPFLGLFRSDDAGESWAMVSSPGRMGCLTVAPDGAIWACGQGQPRPWVAASTTDLGATWDTALDVYTSLAGTWMCPAGSPTALACADRCNPSDQACLDGMFADAGAPDMGVADAGMVADADGLPDLGPAPAGGGSDDCQSVPGGPSAPLGGALFLLGLAWARRRSIFQPVFGLILTPRPAQQHR